MAIKNHQFVSIYKDLADETIRNNFKDAVFSTIKYMIRVIDSDDNFFNNEHIDHGITMERLKFFQGESKPHIVIKTTHGHIVMSVWDDEMIIRLPYSMNLKSDSDQTKIFTDNIQNIFKSMYRKHKLKDVINEKIK